PADGSVPGPGRGGVRLRRSVPGNAPAPRRGPERRSQHDCPGRLPRPGGAVFAPPPGRGQSRTCDARAPENPPINRVFDNPRWLLAAVALAVLVLVPATCIFTYKRPEIVKTTGTARTSEESLESVREVLHKGADLSACRGAVQQINTYLARHTEEKLPTLN